MAHKQGGLLAQIKADVVDHKVPLSSILQNCIVLGGEAGSEKMRTWARRELNGYTGADTVPDYRRVPAVLMAQITNSAGYGGGSVRFDPSVLPAQVREMMTREQIDLDNIILSEGIGELEDMASQGKEAHTLVPSWATFIAHVLTQHNMQPGSRVADVYWSVSNASIRGILVRIRTALAELVAELITMTPQDQEVPDKLAADQAVQFVITGNRATIYYGSQHATDGGTNAMVGDSAPGPVAVSGAHGSAIGSQTASGANSSVVGSQVANGADSSVVGSQAVQVGHDAVAAGRDATTMTSPTDQPVKEGWWARLRKRGVVVTLAIIIGAIAAVVGTLVGIGWKP